MEWVEAGGGATLYTHSMVYRNDLPPFGPQVPYLAAVVDLDEGPRMMTRIVDYGDTPIEIGMRAAHEARGRHRRGVDGGLRPRVTGPWPGSTGT